MNYNIFVPRTNNWILAQLSYLEFAFQNALELTLLSARVSLGSQNLRYSYCHIIHGYPYILWQTFPTSLYLVVTLCSILHTALEHGSHSKDMNAVPSNSFCTCSTVLTFLDAFYSTWRSLLVPYRLDSWANGLGLDSGQEQLCHTK